MTSETASTVDIIIAELREQVAEKLAFSTGMQLAAHCLRGQMDQQKTRSAQRSLFLDVDIAETKAQDARREHNRAARTLKMAIEKRRDQG